MKKFHVGVSIAVAVLAVVSAVFAFLMMQKNGKTQQGWAAFVSEVGKTAKTLDQKSGKPIAGKLSAAALSIDSADQVEGALKVLSRRAKEIVAERDVFADTLSRIANNVGATDVPEDAEMCGLETYIASKDKVFNAVDQAMSNHTRVFEKLNSVAHSQLDASLDVAALRKGDTSAVAPLVEAINKQAGSNRAYERELGNIARLVHSDFNKENVPGVFKGVHTALRGLEAQKRQLERDLNTAKGTIREKESALSDSAAKVASLQQEVSKRDQAIASYKRALGLADAKSEEMPWVDGSIDARRAVVGRVIDVNEDYGYITIDIGSATTVEQKLGTKTLPVNPQLARGMEMIVSRGAIGDDAKFVSRIKLGEVGAKCSTADIPAESDEIEKGDYVYVSL